VTAYFSADSPLPHTYKETRNQMLGPDYSTKFALWLGSGAVSPRRILCELAKFEAEAGETRSSYWIWFELLWRDFFRFQCSKVGTRAFHVGGPRGVTGIAWKNDAGLFEAWRRGRTGYPLVDASMVELNSTGFMSNRSRQIVASFLAKDMGVDWRLGAAHFEETLIDYDCPANWGNWAYGAGVGCDPREDRYFSIPKQGKVYDSEAAYIRTWLPAIAHLPTSQLLGGSRLDVDPDVYPPPVVPLKFGGGRGGGGGYAGRGRGGKDRAQSKQARGGAGEPEGGRGFSATPKERKGKSRNRVQGGW
jgi:deoxyribodipyrimidine photo-lyase